MEVFSLMAYKEWQTPIVELLLSEKISEDNPLRAREAWYHTLSTGSQISRASVILFLQALQRDGFLNKRSQPARGGYHDVYWATQSLKGTVIE